MTQFLKSLFTACSMVALSGIARAAPATNVVFIVADDMGYADTGITGCKDFATPNIDSIAKGGMVFTRAYVTCAVCSPSRAGFLTGQYQQRFGHEHNGGGPPPFGMPLNQKLMPQHFKAAGYATGMIGKWHLGQGDGQHPMDRGFDEFVGHLGGGHAYFPKDDSEGSILDGRAPAKWDEYLTTYFGKRATDFIDRHAASPFFLYLAFNAPHTPLQARPEDLAKVSQIEDNRRRTYAAMMIALDESVGKVLAEIKAKGLEDSTMVVFMSDNGGPQPGDPSVNGSINRPLRSGKAQYYDGGIRVPLFIKLPGTIPAGSTYEKSVSSLDLLPTFMAATGNQPIETVKLDGLNLLPYISGQNTAAPHERLFWRCGAGMALIEGDYKLVWFRREGGLPDNPERVDLTKTQLYKIGEDISEKRELSKEEVERRQKMIATWLEWDKTLVTPLWGTWQKKGEKAD